MAAQGMTYQDLETRRKLLLEELAATTNARNEQIGFQEAMDIHHPERSSAWKKVPFLEFPLTMYHPAKLDPVREELRRGVKRRNDENPLKEPLDVPHPKPMTKVVASKAEEREAEKEGFVRTPPGFVQTAINASSGPRPTLSVEAIIKLNQMGKEELVAHAKEHHGVELPEDASKVDIINAIVNK